MKRRKYALRSRGWDLLVVWECEIEKAAPKLLELIEVFLTGENQIERSD